MITGPAGAPLLVSLLEGSRDLGSDYEAASLLIDVIDRHPIDGAARQPFFDALAGIGSAYEKGRVLQRLLRRSDVSDDALVAAIRESATIDSDHEASRVLMAAARSHSLTGAAREAYVRAAERLAEHDIVVSCTASSLPILGKGLVERALRARRHRPIFMIDLAVPRDIEPEVAERQRTDGLHRAVCDFVASIRAGRSIDRPACQARRALQDGGLHATRPYRAGA